MQSFYNLKTNKQTKKDYGKQNFTELTAFYIKSQQGT